VPLHAGFDGDPAPLVDATIDRTGRDLGQVLDTVVAAAHDRLTPAAHGRRIAEGIGPTAELVVVPGAGHSVNLTRHEVVDEAFLALLDRVEKTWRQAG
jgi:pimeloyl-ACP methyl ester carboxylesterase